MLLGHCIGCCIGRIMSIWMSSIEAIIIDFIRYSLNYFLVGHHPISTWTGVRQYSLSCGHVFCSFRDNQQNIHS